MSNQDLATKSSEIGDDDYIEQRQQCFCSLKSSIYFIGLVVIIDFIVEAFFLHDIDENEYFDDRIYFYGFLSILILFSLAILLILIYFIFPDRPWTRSLIPAALLIATISNLLIFFWILIYITGIYDKDKVMNISRKNDGSRDLDEV